MLVSRSCTGSGHRTPAGIGLGNRIVSDAELSRQQEDVGTQKKVLQEPLYYLWMVPRIDQLLTPGRRFSTSAFTRMPDLAGGQPKAAEKDEFLVAVC